MGGAFVAFASDPGSLFSNSAALAGLEHPVAALSASFLPYQQRVALAGVGVPLGGSCGVSVSLMSYSLGGYQGYAREELPTGPFSSTDLAFSVGGGIGLGPGKLGATLRYLNSSLSGIEGGASGYAVDLSGTMEFDRRFFFALSLNNVAGELKANYDDGPRERVPWNTRLGAAYLIPFEERTATIRLDPSGIAAVEPRRPRSYLLLATEVRASDLDSSIGFSGAAEYVPLVEIPLGFRIGFTSQGDIGSGFFYTLPVEFTRDLRIDYSARRDYEVGEVSHHVTISAGF